MSFNVSHPFVLRPIARLVLVLTLTGGVVACGKSGGSAQDHLAEARKLSQQGKVSAAAIEAKNALQSDPKLAEARQLLGELQLFIGNGPEAEKELRRAVELGVSLETVKPQLGRALLQQYSYDKLLKEVDVSPASSRSNRARILALRAEATQGKGQWDEGCKLYEQALSEDPEFAESYMGQAACVMLKDGAGAARKLLEKAQQLDPKNQSVWITVGNFERLEKQYDAAEKAYAKALALYPGNVNAYLERAAMRLETGHTKEAASDIDAALKLLPGHPIGSFLKGKMKYQEKRYGEAQALFDATLKVLPNYDQAILWLGFSHFAQGHYEQATSQFGQYLTQHPDATNIAALRALALARLGDKDASEKSVAALKGLKVDDPQVLGVIAQTQTLLNQGDEAAKTLERAVSLGANATHTRLSLARMLEAQGKHSEAARQIDEIKDMVKAPTEQVQVIWMLLSKGDHAGALKVVDKMQAADPKSALPYAFRGLTLLLEGKVADAKAQFEKSYTMQPGDSFASMYLARIYESEGQLDKAREVLRKAVGASKDSIRLMLTWVAIEDRAGHHQEARQLLAEIVAKYPERPGPSALLASNYLRENQPLKALEATRLASQAFPDDPDLLKIRGTAYSTAGDVNAAATTFERLVKGRPKDAGAKAMLATAYADKGEFDKSVPLLEDALKADPGNLHYKFSLASVYRQQRKLDDALRLVRAVRKVDPKSVSYAVLEANTLAQQNKSADAIAIMEQTSKSNPNSPQAVMTLASLYENTNSVDKAINVLAPWSSAHSADVAASAYLGALYQSKGAEKEALAAYERGLKVSAADPLLKNNIAWLVRKQDPARALTLAQQAYAALPKDGTVADTLGWLYFEQGKVGKALDVFTAAADKLPNNPETRYHYAAVLAKSGDKAKAKSVLKPVLDAKGTFPQRAEAEALMLSLQR